MRPRARFTITVDVPLSMLTGSALHRYHTLQAIAHEAFGDMPFSIVTLKKNLATGRVAVTLAAGSPTFVLDI